MKNFGVLLEYLSEIGCGSWRDFKQALATSEAAPDSAAVWVASDLSALAHVEFHPETHEWAVCPPALVELPGVGPAVTGLLCGARSPRFLARVYREAEALSGVLEMTEEDIQGVVMAMRFRMPDKDALRAFAANAGLQLIEHAPEQLAACLPTVESLLRASKPEEVAPSPGLERLARAKDDRKCTPWLEWRAAFAVDPEGVYRQEWGFRTVYWWRGSLDGKRESLRTSKATALYGYCRDLMTYDQRNLMALFPTDARPPDLYLRALVLCSGTLPTLVAAGRLGSKQVPPVVAEGVMKKLGQE